MGNTIISIPTARASEQLVRQQLVSSINFNQNQMEALETAISTGQQFQLPGQNPVAAARVLGLKDMVSKNQQYQNNISANQSFLNETDSVLGSVSSLLTSAKSLVLSVVGNTANDSQRAAAATQLTQTLNQLVSIGNTQYNGRYLFGGSDTGQPPFSVNPSGAVVFNGNAQALQSLSGFNALFQTNVSGADAFGAISTPVQGATLVPSLDASTPLGNLNGGAGVTPGSITITDGVRSSTIDLSHAATLGDVATLIHNNPPTGRTVDVQITAAGLTISLEPLSGNPLPDNLAILEVNGGSTASQLGILQKAGVGPGPIVGTSVNPIITSTTPLANLTGSRAQAAITSAGPNNDILLTANTNGATLADGTLLNGVTVQFVNDAPGIGQETASFNAGTPASGNNPGSPGTLTVHVTLGGSTPQAVVNAINNAAGSPFQATINPSDLDGGGQVPYTSLPADTTTAGGGGYNFDQTSGLQIVNDGQTHVVSLASSKTVGDVINAINASGANVLASFTPNQQGIQVSSLVSGADFSIGENGGTTAAELGIRTFNASTSLAELNHGQGVTHYVDSPSAGNAGVDFTITQPTQNVTLSIDLSGATTVGDVISTINAQAAAASSTIHAQLSTTGNGIQLVDTNASNGAITVTANATSTAAQQLGLLAGGSTTTTSTTVAGLQTIAGTDVNPQTNSNVFSSLLLLSSSLQTNDTITQQRAAGMLDNSIDSLTNTRGELGAREQSLTTISTLLSNQNIQLKSDLSDNFDTNMTQAISDFTAAQTSYQAGLAVAGRLLRVSLLDYI